MTATTATTPWRAYLALALGVLTISFSGIFVSLANAPGPVTGFYRLAITAVLLALPAGRRLSQIEKLPKTAVRLALLGGVFFALDIAFWNSGILISGPTTPTFMGNTAPVWVGLGTILIFKRPLRPLFWVGLGVALLGVGGILGSDVVRNVGLGTVYGLLAGIFYGAYFLTMQPSRQWLDALTSFWLAALAGTATLFVLTFVLRQPLLGYSTTTYLYFLALGMVVQVTGHYAINYALGDLPASIVSPTLLGQPVLTGVLAAALLGERLTPLHRVGGTAVILGVYLVHRSQLYAKPTASRG